MGYVSGAFGIRGWLNVVADTEFADSLLDYETWWLKRNGEWHAYVLEEGAVHTKKLAAKLVGVDDRDAAFALKSCEVAVPRSLMPAADEGEYYWADLVGMTVVNTAAESLGVVDKLFATGANDVLVVRDGETERLLPFVAPVVLKVDTEARSITVDWGLDY
ncbi:ribosome maturation factor RimM [Jeongeupia chitinilytica]|uniref:Ribosome maturation factor RimM n=1 Tax=Jeongeupia chitinilytica TaxID=1041641 RepID=A0ABQ3H464_9NEIS|nr:ribosome maturation factor RimM [Jeongeupia chitinilytica]GHD69575.1 ribosome maturation factor RimM [Jeongeupia chitinilytica]